MNQHHVPKKMLTQFQYSTTIIPTSFGHLHLELHRQYTKCFQEPRPSIWLWALSLCRENWAKMLLYMYVQIMKWS